MKNWKRTLLPLLTVVAAVALLAGCESDSVAPNDDIPPLTQEDIASQASIMAMAVHQVSPQVFNPDQSKNQYTYVFGPEEPIQGTLYFDFRCGGAQGTSCAYDTADWGSVYTGFGSLSVEPNLSLTCSLTADINQVDDTAVISGSGTFSGGDYSATWSVAGVEIATDGYPAAGALTFTGGDHVIEVVYDGGGTVSVMADDVEIGTVDLSTGVFTEITE